LKQRRPATLAHSIWQGPSSKWRSTRTRIENPRACFLLSEAGTIKDLQTSSLLKASCQPWAASTAPFWGCP
jgi:hypothetical protein